METHRFESLDSSPDNNSVIYVISSNDGESIILVDSDPRDVVKLIDFGKLTYKKMVQNLIWAVGYNIVAILLAAGVLYPNFILIPAMGAVLMSVSTIVVAINASFLKIKK